MVYARILRRFTALLLDGLMILLVQIIAIALFTNGNVKDYIIPKDVPEAAFSPVQSTDEEIAEEMAHYGIICNEQDGSFLSEMLQALKCDTAYQEAKWGYPIWIDLLGIIFSLFYLIYFPLTSLRGTPGKRIMGICIIGKNGNKIRFWQSFLRCISAAFSSIYFLGFLICIFDKKKRTLHDWAAGTFVVYRDSLPNDFL